MSKELNEGYESNTEEKKQEQTAPAETTLDVADDGFIVTSGSSPTPLIEPTSSISSLSDSISPDGQTLDPITEAIRKEILEKQREQLMLYLSTTHPELEEHTKDDEKFKLFLANLNDQQKGFIEDAFKNEKVKAELEKIELAGYKNVLSTYSAANGYPGGFKPVQWENQISASDLRATVVKNDAGDELCTLNETTVKTKPFTVAKQDGTQVQISSYREIDFPIKLDKADGSMHLSMVALKADGTKPAKDKAVYFTAHYEEGPNGKPLLKEISSPQPLKFAGDGPDAVAYIEHGGEIYTLAVTRGKYQEMMKEVAINKGQSVDLSQTIAEDLTKVQGRTQETPQPIIAPNQGLKSSIETPIAAQTTQMPQPQQAQSSGIPNPVLNAATNLSQAMQDLLNQFNNTVNNKDLTPNAKITGVNTVLETVKSDNALSNSEKSKMLEATVAIVLNSENLDPQYKQQIVGKATALALTFDNELDRWTALNGLGDTIINSNLPSGQKGSMLAVMGDKVNESELSAAEKKQLMGDILEKGKDAGVLTREQQQLMQQNLDKITTEQTKNAEIAEVQGILANSTFNAIAKTEAIQNVTTKVLDNAVKPEVKAETVAGITQTVAESPLDAKDKAGITQGVGQAIATNKTVTSTEQATITESAEKGVASSTADLEDKKLITKSLVDGIYESKASPGVTSKLTEAVSSGIDKSTAIPEDKQALKDAAIEAALERETQNLNKDLSQSVEQTKPQHDIYGAAKGVTDALKGVLDSAIDKSTAIPEDKQALKDAAIEAALERETQNLNKDLSQSVEQTKPQHDIYGAAKGVTDALKGVLDSAIDKSTAIPEDKQAFKDVAIEAALERETQNLNKDLSQSVEQTKPQHDIYGAAKSVTDALKGVLDSAIDKSTAIPEDKQAFKDVAIEAALERETQNLNKDLSQSVEQTKPQHDIYGAAKSVTDALKGVLDSAEEGFKPSKEAEEKIVQETSNTLNNVTNKYANLRNILSSSDDLKTSEKKRTESKQKINEVNEKFNEESSIEEKQDFIKSYLIDNKENLSKDVRLQIIDDLLKKEAEERGAAFKDKDRKSEIQDVRVVSGKSELKPVSKDEPDIEKAKLVVGKDKVNIKDNVKVMEALMNAKNSIQTENLSKSLPIKRESTPPQR